MQRFGRHSQARPTRPRRPRSFNASLEAVEDRTLMSTVSAINWTTPGVQHIEVFALDYNNFVAARKDLGSWSVDYSLRVSQISAGLDTHGNPEVFGIDYNNTTVYCNDNGTGWTYRAGNFTAISASTNDTVFGIDSDQGVWVNRGGTSWANLGNLPTGSLRGQAISAGLDTHGNPEVFAIGTNNAVYSNDGGTGWTARSGYFPAIAGHLTAISASTNDTVFGIDADHHVWVNRGGTSWTYLSGYAQAISAGADAAGNPEVYAIGADNSLSVYGNGGGWSDLGGYVTEISATTDNTVAAWGRNSTAVFLVDPLLFGWELVSLGTPPYIIS
jgi:hypothetical protein